MSRKTIRPDAESLKKLKLGTILAGKVRRILEECGAPKHWGNAEVTLLLRWFLFPNLINLSYPAQGIAAGFGGELYVSAFNGFSNAAPVLALKLTPSGSNWVVSTMAVLQDAFGGNPITNNLLGIAVDTAGNGRVLHIPLAKPLRTQVGSE